MTCSRSREVGLGLSVAMALAVVWTVWPGRVDAEESAEEGAEVEETVVDRVVAVVGSAGQRDGDARIVTAYELEVEARLVVAGRARSVEAGLAATLSRRLLDSVLDTIINHLLVEQEASRLELISVSEDDLRAERAHIEERLGGEGALERFRRALGAPPDLIEALLRRRAVVTAFIRSNLRLAGSITDEDIEAVYRSGNHPFGDRPLEEIRPALEAFILGRRQREALSRLLEEIRARSWVRIIEE